MFDIACHWITCNFMTLKFFNSLSRLFSKPKMMLDRDTHKCTTQYLGKFQNKHSVPTSILNAASTPPHLGPTQLHAPATPPPWHHAAARRCNAASTPPTRHSPLPPRSCTQWQRSLHTTSMASQEPVTVHMVTWPEGLLAAGVWGLVCVLHCVCVCLCL